MKKNKRKLYDYIIHTDGAYSRLNDEGAFAYILCDGSDNMIDRRGWKQNSNTGGTNNRMELKAIIAAIQNLPKDAKVIRVESDSQYALNTLSGRFQRRKNLDLFDIYENIIAGKELDITWKWVRGHNGDKYNELCDEICNLILGYDPSQEYKRGNFYVRQKIQSTT